MLLTPLPPLDRSLLRNFHAEPKRQSLASDRLCVVMATFHPPSKGSEGVMSSTIHSTDAYKASTMGHLGWTGSPTSPRPWPTWSVFYGMWRPMPRFREGEGKGRDGWRLSWQGFSRKERGEVLLAPPCLIDHTSHSSLPLPSSSSLHTHTHQHSPLSPSCVLSTDLQPSVQRP